MLVHEVAADIIDKLSTRKYTVKSLVFSSKYKNIKQLYALVCETLKYRQVLETIIDSTQLLKRERKLATKTKALSVVLLYDFLFGKGLQAAGRWKACILNHKAALNGELARIKVKKGAVMNEDLIPEDMKTENFVLPRYVRVNTLKTDVDEVVKKFVSESYEVVENPGSDHKSFTETLQRLKPKQFTKDLHVENLLVFAPGTDLHAHALYESGHIIFQDKASCFPSYILSPPEGTEVIDCCAAPGNKTSHMAAIMQNTGKIFAFDLDPNRLKTMEKLCDAAGATNISCIHQDFLTVDPDDDQYKNVEYILVDPSCSGSGIASRLNSLTDNEESSSKDRLESLAKFQKTIVKHAMSFPNVKAITYSTCSIHREENEDVVNDVLKDCNGRFKLEHVLENWTHRGIEDVETGKPCVRASQEDLTNGFFVAYFVQISKDSEETASCVVTEVMTSHEPMDLVPLSESPENVDSKSTSTATASPDSTQVVGSSHEPMNVVPSSSPENSSQEIAAMECCDSSPDVVETKLIECIPGESSGDRKSVSLVNTPGSLDVTETKAELAEDSLGSSLDVDVQMGEVKSISPGNTPGSTDIIETKTDLVTPSTSFGNRNPACRAGAVGPSDAVSGVTKDTGTNGNISVKPAVVKKVRKRRRKGSKKSEGAVSSGQDNSTRPGPYNNWLKRSQALAPGDTEEKNDGKSRKRRNRRTATKKKFARENYGDFGLDVYTVPINQQSAGFGAKVGFSEGAPTVGTVEAGRRIAKKRRRRTRQTNGSEIMSSQGSTGLGMMTDAQLGPLNGGRNGPSLGPSNGGAVEASTESLEQKKTNRGGRGGRKRKSDKLSIGTCEGLGNAGYVAAAVDVPGMGCPGLYPPFGYNNAAPFVAGFPESGGMIGSKPKQKKKRKKKAQTGQGIVASGRGQFTDTVHRGFGSGDNAAPFAAGFPESGGMIGSNPKQKKKGKKKAQTGQGIVASGRGQFSDTARRGFGFGDNAAPFATGFPESGGMTGSNSNRNKKGKKKAQTGQGNVASGRSRRGQFSDTVRHRFGFADNAAPFASGFPESGGMSGSKSQNKKKKAQTGQAYVDFGRDQFSDTAHHGFGFGVDAGAGVVGMSHTGQKFSLLGPGMITDSMTGWCQLNTSQKFNLLGPNMNAKKFNLSGPSMNAEPKAKRRKKNKNNAKAKEIDPDETW